MGAVLAFGGFAAVLTLGALIVDRFGDDIELFYERLEDRLYSRGRW